MNISPLKLIALALLAVAITACTPKGEKEIRKISEGYMKALVDYRLEDAKKYGDANTTQFIELQQQIIGSWTPEEREVARKNLENTSVKIVSVEITGDNAVANYELTKDGEIIQAERLYLVKNAAGWQVQESM